MKLKEVLKPALILCVICLLATAALAGTNMLTADTIAQQKVITEQESRKQVLPTRTALKRPTAMPSAKPAAMWPDMCLLPPPRAVAAMYRS